MHKIDAYKFNALRLAIKNSRHQAAMVLLTEFAVGLPPVDGMKQYYDEEGDGTCMSMARDRGLDEVEKYFFHGSLL